jgi:hypothetical protein
VLTVAAGWRTDANAAVATHAATTTIGTNFFIGQTDFDKEIKFYTGVKYPKIMPSVDTGWLMNG